MQHTREIHSEWFGKAIRPAFERKYGRQCTPSLFALKFNTDIGNLERGISVETARRWLKGLSLPEPKRMAALVNWLDIETFDVSGSRSDCMGDVSTAKDREQRVAPSNETVTIECSPQDLEALKRLLSSMLRAHADFKQSRTGV